MRLAFALVLVGCARAPTLTDSPRPLPSVAVSAAPAPPVVTAPGEHTSREWLELGEEAFAHVRLSDAARFYQEALRSRDELEPYAWYKLAYVDWNQNDGPAALDAFVQAIRSADERNQRKIASSARKDIVAVYARYGRPATAFAFFRKIGARVESLGEQYVQDGKWKDAAAIYDALAATSPGHACAYRVRAQAAIEAEQGAPPTTAEITARIARCP